MLSRFRKGQIFSFDLMVSVGIFLVAVLLLIALWVFVVDRIGAHDEELNMADAAIHASNQLLLTGGNPASWHILDFGNVNALGISDGRDNLNSEKLERFIALNGTNYTDVKEMLGVGSYEMYVEVSHLNGTKICEFGNSMKENETETANYVVERMALLNDSAVRVRLEVWK
jgi:hypothetical protein